MKSEHSEPDHLNVVKMVRMKNKQGVKMDTQNIENTLKKMGMLIEKLTLKVDEIDKRVAKLEDKNFSSNDFKSNNEKTQATNTNTFGSSFLGSLTGAFAGMGLYNLLFNHNVTPKDFGENIGLDDHQINEVLQNDISEIDTKLDEIDAKLKEIDSKIDDVSNIEQDVMDNEYFESYEEEVNDNDFEGGFDDFEGLDDFDV